MKIEFVKLEIAINILDEIKFYAQETTSNRISKGFIRN